MDRVIGQIERIARKYKLKKVVLFGSRARCDNTDISDYDIAVFADQLSEIDKARLYNDVDEIETLKKIDVIFIDQNVTEALIKNIIKDGVIIYEQAKSKD